jgi:carbon-monoxide dehydrogenase large subunit
VPTYLYATLLSGQYDIPAIYANVRTVYTNTAPVDAYRGAGRPEATFVLERTMETRRANSACRRRTAAEELHHPVPASDAGHHECYDAGDYEPR